MQFPQVQELVRDQPSCVVLRTELLREVAIRFLTSDCDVLAVTDADGHLAGVITESTVVRSLLVDPSPTLTIEPFISVHADSVRSKASLASVLHMFRSSCHTAVPVVDAEDRVCGLLRRRDVMAAMLNTTKSRSGDTRNRTASAENPGSDATGPVVRDPSARPRPFGTTRVDQASPPSSQKPASTDLPHQCGAAAADPSNAAAGTSSTGGNAEVPPPSILKGSFGNSSHVSGETGRSGHSAPKPDGNAADTGSTKNEADQHRPHFLSGDAARRRLGSLSDFRGGFNENPW